MIVRKSVLLGGGTVLLHFFFYIYIFLRFFDRFPMEVWIIFIQWIIGGGCLHSGVPQFRIMQIDTNGGYI